MIGTGSCALQDSVKLTKASIDVGIYSVLVLPPFYYKPQSDESVFRYFSELISIVDEPKLRIIFYNFPKLTGYNFSIKILNDLKKQFGAIAAGIKDSSGEWTNTLSLIQNVRNFHGISRKCRCFQSFSNVFENFLCVLLLQQAGFSSRNSQSKKNGSP